MVNTTSKVGAVGVVPWFAAKLYPTLLLRMDPGERKTAMTTRYGDFVEGPGPVALAAAALAVRRQVSSFATCRFYGTNHVLVLSLFAEGEELLRDSRGRCVPCQPGEVGQLVGLINDHDPARRFEGYTDSKASAKKVSRFGRRHGPTASSRLSWHETKHEKLVANRVELYRTGPEISNPKIGSRLSFLFIATVEYRLLHTSV